MDVLIVNEIEAATLLSRDLLAAGSEVDAARQLRSSPSQVVVITLGARGAIAVAEDEVVSQPSFAVDVVDTTGAGDAFVAGFAVGLSQGLTSALRLGCAAGALATTRMGAQPSMPALSDVEALLAASPR